MTNNEPQPYTAEEVRQQVLDLMRAYIGVWLKEDRETERERMEGLVFSILNIFDGTTLDLPAMDIVLRPHADDKQFFIDEGQRWYEDGMVINDCLLHEEWHK